jgi:hypothetical protein
MDDVHKIVTDRQFAPPRIGLDVKGYLQQNLRGRKEEVQEKGALRPKREHASIKMSRVASVSGFHASPVSQH